MFNLSDKELDRLSRQAADAFEVEDNPTSWEVLAQKLDKELGVSSGGTNTPGSPGSFRFFRSPFAYPTMAILAVASIYFISKTVLQKKVAGKQDYSIVGKHDNLTNNSSATSGAIPPTEKSQVGAVNNDKPTTNASTNLSDNKTNNAVKDARTISSNNNTNKDEIKKEGDALAVNDIGLKKTVRSNSKTNPSAFAANNSTLNRNGLGHHDGVGENNPALNSYTGDIQSKNNSSLSKNRRNKIKNGLVSGSNGIKPIDNEDITDNSGNLVTAPKSKNNNHTSSKTVSEDQLSYGPIPTLSTVAKPSGVTVSDLALVNEAQKLQAQHAIRPDKNKSHSLSTKRPLQIGLVVAPDFSKVKYVYNNNRMGSSIGLTLDYQLLHRLSVNSGIIYAHKYYEADDDNCNLLPPLVMPNVHVDFMMASTKMFEIPINLRYDISLEGNTRVFVNAGLSSYLMQNQSFQYYFETNGTGVSGYRRTGWAQGNYNSPQNFWFSTLNLSGGFESSLSNAFSLQVEPYIKVPLKGVGVGNVSLSSYGINIGIKYAPVLKRSRH